MGGEEATAAATQSDEEFAELLGFLQAPKVEVQRFAAEGVLEYTESQALLDFCRRNPRKAARPLFRLAEKAEAEAGAPADEASGAAFDGKAAQTAALEAASACAAGSAALQALVNLSTVPAVRDELVELNAPRRAAQALRGGWLEGRCSHAHWYAMLLANISVGKLGQEALVAEEPLLRFLLAAYVAKPRPAVQDGHEDPLFCLGKVLCNVSALQEGRRLLASAGGGDESSTPLAALASELGDRARRPDVLCAFRNICLDVESHKAVVATDLMARLSLFLYPWEKVEPARRGDLPEQLAAALASAGAALTGDAAVRHAAATCLLGLCRSAEGRDYLRAEGCCAVMRAWHLEEPDEQTRMVLESVVPAVHASEEELQAERERQAREAREADAQPPLCALAPPRQGAGRGEEAADASSVPPEVPRAAPGPLPPAAPASPRAPRAPRAGVEEEARAPEEEAPPEGLFDSIQGVGGAEASAT